MKKYDVVIIGAGPAGIITGVTAKKQNPDKSILMIKEEEKGLVPCGIPYVFYNLNSVEKNLMGPKPFIDLGGEVVTNKVVEVDIINKLVTGQSGEKFAFEKLVFATGSEVKIANFIPGHDFKNVFYVKKSYNYINHLFNELKDKKNIVIVGGGFIGAEVAEQLAKHEDKTVSVIESEEFCFSKAFSAELSEIATEELKKANVNVYTSTLVKEVLGKEGAVSGIKFSDNKEIEADAVIFAIGYLPNVDLAENAGLKTNDTGAIVVDNYGRTSENNIYAVGDCSQTTGFLTGQCNYIMLASTATAEARVLGYNLFGIKIKNHFSGTIGIFSTKINNLAMAAAGVNEKNAVPANVEFVTSKFTGVDRHPGSISDASSLTAKLYISPIDGSILGGEIWGGESVGELINIIGLAIQKGATIYELISYQIGTHPLLTGSPTMPVIIKAAELALSKIH
jgi:NADPH-dependent 2,4-dienoyl-CoA reductase/sulfur reductase-like enzyme